MITLTTVIAICCLSAAKAFPGMLFSSSGSSGKIELEGVPDIESYNHISYPHYDLIDLGEYSKGHVPGDEIKITKDSKLTIPQPYPVKVPIPQPYPVHIEKPYPVVETKFVKVPYPVPQVIEKKVPYPVEVPKPYPVQVHSEDGGGGDSGGFGGSFQDHHSYEGNGYGLQESGAELPSNEGYEAGIGGGSGSLYEAKALEEQTYSGEAEGGAWQPISGDLEGKGY